MNPKDKNPRRVFITDTTLRDGEQSPGCHMTPEQKLEIAERLAEVRMDAIEAGFPVSSPMEFEAVKRIADTVGTRADAPGDRRIRP